MLASSTNTWQPAATEAVTGTNTAGLSVRLLPFGSCLSFLPHRHLEPSCVSLPNQECPLDLRIDSWLNVPFSFSDPNRITYSLSQPTTKLLWTAWRKEVPLWCGREKGFAFSETFFLHICSHTPWWKETLWLSLNTAMSVYLIMIFPDSYDTKYMEPVALPLGGNNSIV